MSKIIQLNVRLKVLLAESVQRKMLDSSGVYGVFDVDVDNIEYISMPLCLDYNKWTFSSVKETILEAIVDSFLYDDVLDIEYYSCEDKIYIKYFEDKQDKHVLILEVLDGQLCQGYKCKDAMAYLCHEEEILTFD